MAERPFVLLLDGKQVGEFVCLSESQSPMGRSFFAHGNFGGDEQAEAVKNAACTVEPRDFALAFDDGALYADGVRVICVDRPKGSYSWHLSLYIDSSRVGRPLASTRESEG